METSPPDPDASSNAHQRPSTNQSESGMGDNDENPDTEVRIQINSITVYDNEENVSQTKEVTSESERSNDLVLDVDGNEDSTGGASSEYPSSEVLADREGDITRTQEGAVVVVGDVENDDDDDDSDDRIDIRDNANDEDQFAFEDNNGVGGVAANQQNPLNGTIEAAQSKTARNHGDDQQHAATNRVSFADENHPRHEYHHEHHHLDDRFHGSPTESYEDDGEDYTRDEKSLDVLLLEEICEEAANMTIKEALLHSLKPNVRAGLTTAHLRLNESEIMTLEGYCEDFVGGLIKDLLRRASFLQNADAEAQKNVVQAAAIKSAAKQLSSMNIKHLKVYCNHFVHNVIAESIMDSSMMVVKQQHQAEQIKELLRWFQGSEELQEYFTSLTTNIVRTALINVVTKDDLEEPTESHRAEQLESSEFEGSESLERTSYSGDQEFEIHGDEDFDFDDDHSFGLPLPNSESPAFYSKEASQKKRSKYGHSPQHPGDTSLEFDMDWVEDALHDISGVDGERRHKIVMRELEFDDRADVGGTELLAPVFLAIAEENEDDSEFQGMRRKTQSIEDLCGLIEEEKEPPRKRSSSLNQAKPKRKQRAKQPPTSYHEYTQDDEKTSINDEPSPPDPHVLHAETHVQTPKSFDVTKTIHEKMYHAYDDEQYRWHTIRVNNREKVLDLRLIEPYMKVITHGGVHMSSRAVIVVIAACYFPDKSKRNYDFLMEQIFFYLISTLELLATADEYFLVYFNGGTTQSNMPAFPWMKRFYQHVEARLKRNMIKMFIVHPTFWLKTVIRFAKAFVGTNFWSKLEFMKSLDDLSAQIPTEFMYLPDEVIRSDPKYKRLHNL